MRFARWVFLMAGIYGLIVTTPMFFLENRIGQDYPPAITHPEYFYGFAGLCFAWQIVFILIGRDPMRYRPLMLIGIVEKGSFMFPVPILYLLGRVSAPIFGFAMIDTLLAILFAVSYWKTQSVSVSTAR